MPYSAKQTRFIHILTQSFLEEIRFIESVRCGRATRRETLSETGINVTLSLVASVGGTIGSAAAAVLAFGSLFSTTSGKPARGAC